MRAITRGLMPLLVLSACATTEVVSDWRDPAYDQKVRKVLVTGFHHKPEVREAFERSLVEDLRKTGVEAHALSERVAPETFELPQDELRAAVRTVAEEGNYDAVIVSQLVDAKTEAEYVPAYPATAFDPWWGSAYPTAYAPGYWDSVTDYRVETRMFDTATEGRLIWEMTSDTFDPSTLEEAVGDLNGKVVEQLRKQGLI